MTTPQTLTHPATLSGSAPSLTLTFPKGRRTIALQDIVRLEGDYNYTTCFFSDGTHLLVALTLKKLLARLPDGALVRLHRKHAVNPGFVAQWQPQNHLVRMTTGDNVAIARRRSSVQPVPTLST
jgi:two-component system, LytTR family, response regulator